MSVQKIYLQICVCACAQTQTYRCVYRIIYISTQENKLECKAQLTGHSLAVLNKI